MLITTHGPRQWLRRQSWRPMGGELESTATLPPVPWGVLGSTERENRDTCQELWYCGTLVYLKSIPLPLSSLPPTLLNLLLIPCFPPQGYIEQGLFCFTYGAKDSLVDFLHADNFVQAHIKAAESLVSPLSPAVRTDWTCDSFWLLLGLRLTKFTSHI